jgi:hypothetical protein
MEGPAFFVRNSSSHVRRNPPRLVPQPSKVYDLFAMSPCFKIFRGMGEQPPALLSRVAVALSSYMTSKTQSSGHVRLKPTRKADDLLVLDGEAVVDLLRATIEREGSQTAFAKHHRH